MKSIVLALLATCLLLTSCGSNTSQQSGSAYLNRSALYDPSSVTLIRGRDYVFEEGTVVGDGQQFHSTYAYARALMTGERGNE